MNTPSTTNNPFETSTAVAQEGGALVESESQRAIQEVQAAMVIAKKFPRNERDATDRIINACTRPTLANSALYSYPRGGQEVTGPSIRLAEAIAQAWGNMQFGIRELSQANGESTVEAYAWDIESNTRQVKVFQVPHKRFTRKGVVQLKDPRDIYELVANQGARRVRNCILGVIPGDVIEAAINQCAVTQQANVDTDPETIKKMVKAFEPFDVTKELIELRIGKRIEAILPAQLLALKKIYQSLRDGMSKASDWFEVVEPTSKAAQSDVQDILTKAKASLEEPAKTEPAPEQPKYSKVARDFKKLVGLANSTKDLEAIVSMDGWNLLEPGEAPALQEEIQKAKDSFTDPV